MKTCTYDQTPGAGGHPGDNGSSVFVVSCEMPSIG